MFVAKLYIIAGCNGAGKTTASFTILPEILDCMEFVNADEIARGLSPFQPEKVAIEAGRIMLNRIGDLLNLNINFAFETTLSTKTLLSYIRKAKENGFEITLLFFWLSSIELAIERVKIRVVEGGHDIPVETITRRYKRGLNNFFKIYSDEVQNWMFINNSGTKYKEIAQRIGNNEIIYEQDLWVKIKKTYGQNII